MCRQYNDYGSIVRDRLESNLNSVNFPEFGALGEDDGVVEDDSAVSTVEEGLKADLFAVAEYERKCLQLAKGELNKLVSKRTQDMLSLFVDVTDLYWQIYVARDIASRMR